MKRSQLSIVFTGEAQRISAELNVPLILNNVSSNAGSDGSSIRLDILNAPDQSLSIQGGAKRRTGIAQFTATGQKGEGEQGILSLCDSIADYFPDNRVLSTSFGIIDIYQPTQVSPVIVSDSGASAAVSVYFSVIFSEE
ncbi:MAG: hypothetical protein [Bacteriophage sp.]|nr:MAG: hypothetical protein [Bacteriophage sp.]